MFINSASKLGRYAWKWLMQFVGRQIIEIGEKCSQIIPPLNFCFLGKFQTWEKTIQWEFTTQYEVSVSQRILLLKNRTKVVFRFYFKRLRYLGWFCMKRHLTRVFRHPIKKGQWIELQTSLRLLWEVQKTVKLGSTWQKEGEQASCTQLD